MSQYVFRTTASYMLLKDDLRISQHRKNLIETKNNPKFLDLYASTYGTYHNHSLQLKWMTVKLRPSHL